MWFKRIGFFILTNILIVLTISIVTSVLGVGQYITAYGIDYNNLLVFCLLWGMVGAFISLALSKVSAKWMMGVKVIDPKKATGIELEIYQKVARFAKSAGLVTPEVGIFESPEVNAFATGPTKSSSLVAVSTGLLNRMNSEEVDGVLAHEVSHIANGDMITMTLIQGSVNAFVMFFSRVISFALGQMVKEEMQTVVRIVSTIVLDIAFSILGSIVVSYFSRAREFRADAGGAKLAGRNAMIAALENLRRYADQPADERGEALATLKISSTKGGGLRALFSTHPSLEDRIAALRSARTF